MSLGIYGGGVPFARYESGRIPPGLTYRSTANGVEFVGVATQPGRYVSYWLGPFPDPSIYRETESPCFEDATHLGYMGFRCNYIGCHEGVGHVTISRNGQVVYDSYPATRMRIPLFGNPNETNNFSATVVYDGDNHCCDRAEFTTWKINRGWGFLSDPGSPQDPWNVGTDTAPNWDTILLPNPNTYYHCGGQGCGTNGYYKGNATLLGLHNMDNLSGCEHVTTDPVSWAFDIPENVNELFGWCPKFACPVFRNIIDGGLIEFCPPTRFAIVIIIPPTGGVGDPGIQDPLPDPSLVEFSDSHTLSLSPVTWGKAFRALREVPIANAKRSVWPITRKLSIDFQMVGTGKDLAHFETPVIANSNAGFLISSEGSSNQASPVKVDIYNATLYPGGSTSPSQPLNPNGAIYLPWEPRIISSLDPQNTTTEFGVVIKNLPVFAGKWYTFMVDQMHLPTGNDGFPNGTAPSVKFTLGLNGGPTAGPGQPTGGILYSAATASFHYDVNGTRLAGSTRQQNPQKGTSSNWGPWVTHFLTIGPMDQSGLATLGLSAVGNPDKPLVISGFNYFEAEIPLHADDHRAVVVSSASTYAFNNTGSTPYSAGGTSYASPNDPYSSGCPLVDVAYDPDIPLEVNTDGGRTAGAWNSGFAVPPEAQTSNPKRVAKNTDLSAIDYTASDWNVVGATPSSQQTPENTLMSANQRIFGQASPSVPVIDGSTRQSAINYTLRLSPSSQYRFFSTAFNSIPLQFGELRVLAIEDGKAESDPSARIRLRRYNSTNPSQVGDQINMFPASWADLYAEPYGALLPYKNVTNSAEDRTYFLGIIVPPRENPTTLTLSATLKVKNQPQ